MSKSIIAIFRKEVYEPLGEILKKEGDQGFIKKGPSLVKKFYKKYPGELCCLETKPAQSGYTRKKVICDNGRHAVRCMEWCPDTKSLIHEHGGRPCFDIVLGGEIDVVDYQPQKQKDGNFKLEKTREYTVGVGNFVTVDPTNGNSEVHEVINHKERSKSLHFYPIDHRYLGIYKKTKKNSGDLYEHIVCDVPND